MKDENLIIKINEYFDGELKKAHEPALFSALAENDEAREYFKMIHSLHSAVEMSAEEFPPVLERKIFTSIKRATEPRKPVWEFFRKPALVISYAVTTILLIASIYLYSESLKYRENIEFTSRRIEKQSEMINLLINSLPAAKVESKLNNPIIIKADL